jgi:hypothetical protein
MLSSAQSVPELGHAGELDSGRFLAGSSQAWLDRSRLNGEKSFYCNDVSMLFQKVLVAVSGRNVKALFTSLQKHAKPGFRFCSFTVSSVGGFVHLERCTNPYRQLGGFVHKPIPAKAYL